MEYTHILETSFGDLYRRLYVIRGNCHIIPTGMRGERQCIDHIQTSLFYIMPALVPCDLEHEQGGERVVGGVYEEQGVNRGEILGFGTVVAVDLEFDPFT